MTNSHFNVKLNVICSGSIGLLRQKLATFIKMYFSHIMFSLVYNHLKLRMVVFALAETEPIIST